MEPFLIHQTWQADTAQGQKANGGPEFSRSSISRQFVRKWQSTGFLVMNVGKLLFEDPPGGRTGREYLDSMKTNLLVKLIHNHQIVLDLEASYKELSGLVVECTP